MKRPVFAIIALALATSLYSQTAVLQNIKGKVEVKALGKDWAPAANGMKVDLLATISTGFDSSVVLLIADNKISVAPLTRLTIDAIVAQSNSLKTSLHLRVGSVSAEVKSTKGVSQDFKVTSPYSTASVRGTKFSYDGFHLDVREGRVAFIPGRPVRDIVIPASARPRPAAPPPIVVPEGATPSGAAAPEGGSSPEGTPPAEVVAPEGTAPADGTPPAEGAAPAEGGGSGVGMTDFMTALQEEFQGDTFSLMDDSGAALTPSGAPAAEGETPADSANPSTSPQAVYVPAGAVAVLTVDYSAPATPSASNPAPVVVGSSDGATPLPGGTGGDGGTGDSGSTTDPVTPPAPPTPPAPTTGTIIVTWK